MKLCTSCKNSLINYYHQKLFASSTLSAPKPQKKKNRPIILVIPFNFDQNNDQMNHRETNKNDRYPRKDQGWCTLTSSPWYGEKVLKHRERKRGIVNSWARPSRYVTSFDFASFKQSEDRLRQGLGVHRVSINNATFNLAWGIGFVSPPLGNDVLKLPCKWSNTTVFVDYRGVRSSPGWI